MLSSLNHLVESNNTGISYASCHLCCMALATGLEKASLSGRL